MKVDQLEGEGEELRGKIPSNCGEGDHQGLDVPPDSRKRMDGKLHQIFGMTGVQAEKAFADLDESERN